MEFSLLVLLDSNTNVTQKQLGRELGVAQRGLVKQWLAGGLNTAERAMLVELLEKVAFRPAD